MRHIRLVTATVLSAVLLALLPSAAGYCGIVNFREETAASSYRNLEGSTIWYEDGVDEADLYEAATAWVMLPQGIQEAFFEYNVRIYLSFSAQSDPGDVLYVTGETHYPRYICSRSDLTILETQGSAYVVCLTDNTSIRRTILHEAGHVFDGILSTQRNGRICGASLFTLSQSSGWLTSCTDYAAAMEGIDENTELNTYNEVETLAEAFRLYCENPEILKSAAPGAYEYIEDALEFYELTW